jgi:predicted MFS family arabinose efflux permease
LVSKDDLAAASALNGIEFNIARAVGPALAGAVIAVAGIATAFLVNFASFFGVILVVARWKRPVRKSTAPPETFAGATVAALRYVRYSPAILTVVVRTAVITFFSSALFALLPSIARSVNQSAIGYGLLLGCFGAGAIAGALIMQRARARWSTEVIVSAGVSILGLVMVSTSGLHRLSTLAPVMLIGGAAWVLIVSLTNALVQSLAPDWVRARVIAVFILLYQGGFALGSAAWGAVAQRAGVGTALVCAGAGSIASLVFALFAKLPESTADLSPWNHWRMPVVVKGGLSDADQGPVLITVEYWIIPERRAEFVETIHLYERVRRRDGASRWGIYRDTEAGDRYLETFIVSSWAEHQRQHERVTQADHELEQRLSDYLVKQPQTHHLLFVRASESI